MPAFCRDEFDGSNHNDHVWRWRNEEAGDYRFARRTWQQAIRAERVCFDIDCLDHIKMSRRDRNDDNREAIRNGDTAIY